MAKHNKHHVVKAIKPSQTDEIQQALEYDST